MELTAGHVWIMVSAALVLFMTPGLAFFYGGMTRAKAALNMMMMSFVSIGLVGVVWVLWGFSMTGGDGVAGLFGSPFASFGLEGLIGTEDMISAGFGATFCNGPMLGIPSAVEPPFTSTPAPPSARRRADPRR